MGLTKLGSTHRTLVQIQQIWLHALSGFRISYATIEDFSLKQLKQIQLVNN